MSEIQFFIGGKSEIQFEDSLARAFWEAFTCPPYWDGGVKMKLGAVDEKNTARWFVRTFLDAGMQAVVAFGNSPGKSQNDRPILGFAFGGIMSEEMLKMFQLSEYGAEVGDGILPFAGILPVVQGCRIDPDKFHILRQGNGLPLQGRESGVSLYRILFAKRLELPQLQTCKKIFMRTRRVLPSVIEMATRFGFGYKGTFYTIWQGEQTQDRMVFCKEK